MSKGGSQTTETKQEIPKWLSDAAQDAIVRANQTSQIGYVPYSGPQVAAFSPMQNYSFAGTNMAAAAYGLPSSQGNGMPAPETFAGGVQGYSSMPLYNQALAQLQQSNPTQYAAIMGMFPNGMGATGGQTNGRRGGMPQEIGAAPGLLSSKRM